MSTDVTLDNIHIAFQLGWSIIDLRNRILINALSVSMDKKTLKTVSNLSSPLPPSPTGPEQYSELNLIAKSAYDKIHYSLKAALGQEITDKIKDLSPIPDNGSLPSSQPGDDIWMTSGWRTLFQRIVALHLSRFKEKENDATDTVYDVFLPPENSRTDKPQLYDYYFLYPLTIRGGDPKDDYPNRGIPPTDLWKKDVDPTKNFALSELTRRALNCLILLFTNPSESVIPVEKYRNQAVADVLLGAAPVPVAPAPVASADATSAPVTPAAEDYLIAMKIFSGLVVRLLDSWDGFLREKYYVDPTPTPATDRSTFTSQTELLAYEAGRSMSSLSWDISATLVPLEKMAKVVEIMPGGDLEKSLTKKVQKTFQEKLTGRNADYVQQQISGLSTAMDNLYYDNTPSIERPAPNDPQKPINPDLPSESLSVITTSLDYWQRAVNQIAPSLQTSALAAASAAPANAAVNPIAPSPQTSALAAASAAPANAAVNPIAPLPQTSAPAAASAAPARATVNQSKPSPQNHPPKESTMAKISSFLQLFQPSDQGQQVALASIYRSVQPAKPQAQQISSPSPSPINWANVLTWDTSQDLRLALIQQSNIWQALFLSEQSLRSFSGAKFTQGLLTKLMQEIEKVISASPEARKLPGEAIFIILGIAALILIAVVIATLLHANLQNIGVSLLVITGGVFGFLGSMVNRIGDIFKQAPSTTTTTTKPGTTTTTSATDTTTGTTSTTTSSTNPTLEKLSALVGIAGTLLIQTFEAAYDRIKIEFGHLNYAVSVSDPLIQFFFDSNLKRIDQTSIDTTIRDGYDFLTKVVWTEKDLQDEIDRVMSTALGPISIYIKSSSTQGTQTDKNTH